MIRELMSSGYERTIGSLTRAFWGFFGPLLRNENLLPVIYMLIITGLAGGFMCALAYPVPNQGILVYPAAGAQTIPEAILNSFVALLGGAGIYLVYMSGRQTVRARAVNLYLGIALLMIAVSTLAGVQLVLLKGE